MTTILAIVVSAVLFWPGSEEKNPIPTAIQTNNQIPNSIEDKLKNESQFKHEITNEQKNVVDKIHENNFTTNANSDQHKESQLVLNDSSLILEKLDNKEVIDTSEVTYWQVDTINKKLIPHYDSLPSLETHKKAKPLDEKKKYEYPEQILDSTSFIDLNQKELKSFGFGYSGQRIEIKFRVNKKEMGSYWSIRGFGVCLNIKDDDTEFFTEEVIDEVIPMRITDEEGKGFVKMQIPIEQLSNIYVGNLDQKSITLLPLRIAKFTYNNNFPEQDVIYWFLPTQAFFDRLPKQIGKNLLEEYNYIIAPNKAELHKPVCKYFDECRNTLQVSNFKVFPNPANAQATVSFTLPEAIDGKISLVDLAGREMQILHPQTNFSAGDHRIEVNLQSVPEGIYLITLYSDAGIQTKRLIISR